jgi:TPP-dependent indolepyruvate ferredoxin oxidoreductase alpha subunit
MTKGTVADGIAFALHDLGVKVLTHVPGYGGSETFQSFKNIAMKNPPISFNEEVAYSIAHGASMVGQRSALLTKSQGFVKAGNAVTDSLYTELTAGFVTIIFEDKVGSRSDNIMEIEPTLQGFYFPYEVGNEENIYNEVIKCFQESEKRKIPFALLVDAAKIEMPISFERRNDLKKNFEYKRNILDHVVSPLLSEYQNKVFSAKKFYGDSSAIERPELPLVPDKLPERMKPTAIKYLPFFDAFKEFRGDIVTGDTSTSSAFALPPYNAIDLVTHIGGSIPLAVGAYSAGFKNVWALTGDFGFIASGHMGLVEIIQRNIPIKIVIFYNKQAAATGGQQIPKIILMRMLAGYNNYLIHLSNPSDPFEINQALTEVSEADDFKILLINY